MKSETLGQTLLKYRTLHQYTQEEVGKYLNIQRQTYSNYERDIRTPDPKTLAALATLYRISLDELLLAGSLQDDGQYEFYHNALTDSPDSCLHLSGTEAKLIMDYRSLPSELQQQLIRHVRFLKSEAEELH